MLHFNIFVTICKEVLMGYKVLDCTLRDGAYVVDSKFGEKRICDIITTLENARMRLVKKLCS